MTLPYLLARLLPYMFRFGRIFRPIVHRSKDILILRPDWVRKVLSESPAKISISEINGDKMARTSGEFILGMEAGSKRYQEDMGLLRQAFRNEDVLGVAKIREIAAHATGEILAGARADGRLEVVGDLARKVPIRVVQEYFGVKGPDDGTLIRWLRDQFDFLFFDLDGDREKEEKALAASEEMRSYLEERMSEGDLIPGTVFHTMVRQGMSRDFILRTLGGMIIGVVETTAKAAANIIDWYLGRPEELRLLRAALATHGRLPQGFVLEALRFNPVNPVIPRYCRENYPLDDADAESVLPKGRRILAATLSAMFDPVTFPKPFRFNPDRPAKNYLHFGLKHHLCQGDHLAPEILSVVVGEFFRSSEWRRAPGKRGWLRYEGSLAHSLTLLPAGPPAGAADEAAREAANRGAETPLETSPSSGVAA